MAKFIKEFEMNIELYKMKNRYGNSLFKYGLIGEERVAFCLKKCQEDILCLYDVVLKIGNTRTQFDFLIIGRGKIIILEVKNLLGNIIIDSKGNVGREIYKNGIIEKCGMENPLTQINYQMSQLDYYLKAKEEKYEIKGLLVMGNDKTIIYNNSNYSNIIKYEEVNTYLKKEYMWMKLLEKDRKVANMILECAINHNYEYLKKVKEKMFEQYTPHFENKEDEAQYLEVIRIRNKYCKSLGIPACNIFNNIEAERLVINKPQNREQFINIKGFKEKRYETFGEEIIKIFKKE